MPGESFVKFRVFCSFVLSHQMCVLVWLCHFTRQLMYSSGYILSFPSFSLSLFQLPCCVIELNQQPPHSLFTTTCSFRCRPHTLTWKTNAYISLLYSSFSFSFISSLSFSLCLLAFSPTSACNFSLSSLFKCNSYFAWNMVKWHKWLPNCQRRPWCPWLRGASRHTKFYSLNYVQINRIWIFRIQLPVDASLASVKARCRRRGKKMKCKSRGGKWKKENVLCISVLKCVGECRLCMCMCVVCCVCLCKLILTFERSLNISPFLLSLMFNFKAHIHYFWYLRIHHTLTELVNRTWGQIKRQIKSEETLMPHRKFIFRWVIDSLLSLSRCF